MIRNALNKLVEGYNLSEKETYDFVIALNDKKLTDAQIGAFLLGLTMKGPTIEEVAGIVRGMKDVCNAIRPKVKVLIDTCGTGGGLTTFNISTANAILASCEVAVAKHGSKSISSLSGSADVLEALGVNINLKPEQAELGFQLFPLEVEKARRDCNRTTRRIFSEDLDTSLWNHRSLYT